MTEYVAAGGNRHPSVADWYQDILAYGADRNIALWHPLTSENSVEALLVGHSDTVNVVKFCQSPSSFYLISGSVDQTIRIWSPKVHSTAAPTDFECVQILDAHFGSINCIAVFPEALVFASGSADATVKIWRIDPSDEPSNLVHLVQTIQLKPRFFPLALAVTCVNNSATSLILAVGGTTASVQLFTTDLSLRKETGFELIATLSGHEGWIRSLAFTQEIDGLHKDLILSSASQDKYIRLWRIHQGQELPAAAATGSDLALGAFLPGKSLSNKAHRFRLAENDYSATFEALLLGHEDWIYSTAWKRTENKLQLLSASADSSLAVWQQDPTSGIWVTVARLGEISAEKGATTATGSTGGFWTGLWSPDGKTVACLGRTGSWRLWNFHHTEERWIQRDGTSGHTRSVTGIAWSRGGEYLLSTSSDQTTRLHAQSIINHQNSWHEMCRPQIHGYDLNCIDSLGDSSFVSGADEKLLRVFKEPRAVAELLQHICGIDQRDIQDMADAANMPALGLSNKAIDAIDDDKEPEVRNERDRDTIDPTSILHKSTLNMDHPPFEDHLSRYTLWPEIEKLYGHGYEISTLAASHDGSVIATACKASSIDHAVIRLFETKYWHEIKPPLMAHSLTATRLRFSADDKYLLSVGRDRQWALFERIDASDQQSNSYKVYQSNPKGHTRMILDAAWVPGARRAFATAGRDKQVKLWSQKSQDDEVFSCQSIITAESSVTAIDFISSITNTGFTYLAVGTETGKVTLHRIDLKDLTLTQTYVIDARLCPSKAITQLSWRPTHGTHVEQRDEELAVSSEDCSLRIFALRRLIRASS